MTRSKSVDIALTPEQLAYVRELVTHDIGVCATFTNGFAKSLYPMGCGMTSLWDKDTTSNEAAAARRYSMT